MKITSNQHNNKDNYDVMSLFSLLKLQKNKNYVIHSGESKNNIKIMMYLICREKIMKEFYSILRNK